MPGNEARVGSRVYIVYSTNVLLGLGKCDITYICESLLLVSGMVYGLSFGGQGMCSLLYMDMVWSA